MNLDNEAYNDACVECTRKQLDIELLLSQNGKLQELLIKAEKELQALKMGEVIQKGRVQIGDRFVRIKHLMQEEVPGIGDS